MVVRQRKGAIAGASNDRLPTSAAVMVISDLACPWCYVGLKRLDKALAGMPIQTDKEWHAFLLDWNAPQGGA